MFAGVFAKRVSVFFFDGTATTEIYALSLHDALPIFVVRDFMIIVIYQIFKTRLDIYRRGTLLCVK